MVSFLEDHVIAMANHKMESNCVAGKSF